MANTIVMADIMANNLVMANIVDFLSSYADVARLSQSCKVAAKTLESTMEKAKIDVRACDEFLLQDVKDELLREASEESDWEEYPFSSQVSART